MTNFDTFLSTPSTSQQNTNFDEFLGTNTETQETQINTFTDSKFRAKIKEVREKVKNSVNLKPFESTIDNIEKSKLSDTDKATLWNLFELFMKSSDESENMDLLLRFSEFHRDYEEQTQQITTKARQKEVEVQEDVDFWEQMGEYATAPLAMINAYFWPSEEVTKIEEISIDGRVESVEEFVSRIDKLKKVFPTTKIFSTLDSESQSRFLSFLDQISQKIKTENEQSLSRVNSEFDNLARQIDRQSEGRVTVNFGGSIGEIPFSSKAEAFSFVENTKQETEDELQGMIRNLAEDIGGLILTGLYYGYEGLSLPYDVYGDKIVETKNDWENEAGGLEYTWNALGLLVGGFAVVNYTETLIRRVVTDNLGKFGFKKYTYTSFDRQQLTFNATDMGREEQEDLNNRIDTYRYLEEKGASLTGEHKIAFDKELEKLRGYIGIKGNTFWLKTRALRLDRGIGTRYLYSVKYGPRFTPYNIARYERDFIVTRSGEEKKRLKTALAYVFEDPSFQETENSRRIERVNHKGESENIKNIKKFIHSRSDLSEAEKRVRIERIDNFLNRLEVQPRGEAFIKSQLVAIAENGQLEIDEIKNKLFVRYPLLKESLDDNSKLEWKDVKRALIKAYGENAPASYTKSHALAFRVLKIVEEGNWSGNQQQLEKVFALIESGKLEISHIYKFSAVNPIRLLHTVTRTFGRYGIQFPQFSRLSNQTSGYSGTTLEKMLTEGREFDSKVKDLQNIVANGQDIESVRYYPVQALENYIKYDISDADEARLKPIFEDFLQLIKDGKILLTPTEFYQELQRLKDGFIPTPVLLSRLEEAKAKELKGNEAGEIQERESIFKKLHIFEFYLKDRTDIPTSAKEPILENLKATAMLVYSGEYEEAAKSLKTIINGNIGPTLREMLQKILRSLARVTDIRTRRRIKNPTGTTETPASKYDPWIEQAKKGRLSLTEKDLGEVIKGDLEYDELESYNVDNFKKKDGEDFVKDMDQFKDLGKYAFRESLGISESANIAEIEQALEKKYSTEIELANIYDIIKGRPTSVSGELKLFAQYIDKNDSTRGQAREILEEIFMKGKSFSDIDTRTIISGTSDNATEFNKKQTLKDSVSIEYEKLDDAGKQRVHRYIRDNNIERVNLPDAIKIALENEDATRKAGPEKLAQITADKAEISRLRGELASATFPERLAGVQKEFNEYMKEEGRRGKPELAGAIADFGTEYKAAETRIQDEARSQAEAREKAELEKHKKTLEAKITSIQRRSGERLEALGEDFDNYIVENNLEGKDGIADIQARFETAYQTKASLNLGGSVDNGKAKTPESSEKTEGGNKEKITGYDGLKKYLDSIYISVFISGDEEALQKLSDEYTKINLNTDGYRDTVLSGASIEDYYKTHLGVNTFQADEESLGKLHELETRLGEIDERFKGISEFSDLGKLVAEITDSTVRGNIANELRGASKK